MELVTISDTHKVLTPTASAPHRPSDSRTTSLPETRLAPDFGISASESSQVNATGYVVLSRFTVAQMTAEVKQSFKDRPHQVDGAVGFVRMEVLSPCDAPDEIWLITYWKDESSYRNWHHSHLYKESHRGIPKGLRLVPKSVSLRFFEHVAS